MRLRIIPGEIVMAPWSFVLGAVLVVAMVVTAEARISCTKPFKPICTTSTGGFASEFEFDRCRLEVDVFKRDTQAYVECLRIEGAASAADYNEAVDRFNDRVGQSDLDQGSPQR